ncbi:MAG: type II/IV secretion system ATPase subunit, partial [Thermoplasmatales archaeon]|nr:type II/IV secretion system ATPase subunit [Thermoplasmatales archaeon]
MGLLEKAQQKKQNPNETKDTTESTIKIENAIEQVNTTSLLERAKQRANHLSEITREITVRETTEKQEPSIVHLDILKNRGDENKEIIDERKGFGWKGQGSRRIVYDNNISEYVYEVSEPVLDKNELEIKKELSHLFKMLADVNISSTENEEKEKYLEETLEQIVSDNNINFHITEEKDGSSKKSFKDFLHIKSKNNNEEAKLESDEDKSAENISSPQRTDKKGKTKEEQEKEEEEIELAAKESKDKIFYHVFREFIGYGPIDIVMKDDGIEDISCDGHHVPIFLYHKKYESISTNIHFENEEHLTSFVVRLAQICGKQISIYSPIVDGKLPDGSRLQTTLARTVTKGSTFTIRRFRENPLTPIDLIEFKS